MDKPPSPKEGNAGLKKFYDYMKLRESATKRRFDHEFNIKELSRWEKYYFTLSSKHPKESEKSNHYLKVSKLCRILIDEYGPISSPKKRPPKPFTPTPFKYPQFPDYITHRIHFMESPNIKRRRAARLAEHAPFISRQTSVKGRVLLSVGMTTNEVLLFERIVDTLDGLASSGMKSSGFGSNFHQADIMHDNKNANRYSWQARLPDNDCTYFGYKGVPGDLPSLDVAVFWDPDPGWRNIMKLTNENRMEEALTLVETMPIADREHLLDEVIYLHFLTNTIPKAEDLVYLSKRHIQKSLISDQLKEEFNEFQKYLDRELLANPPELKKIHSLSDDYGEWFKPVRPPASDWLAIKESRSIWTKQGGSRGRIFAINYYIDHDNIERNFKEYMVAAENAFRHDRLISKKNAERAWVSEETLLSLVKKFWPSAISQWSPHFLGLQSIDIYIPEENLAIEYQGQQHYEPVDFFGGEKSFIKTCERDDRKRKLLEFHNVKLLEWRYDVPIKTSELERRLNDLGIEIPGNSCEPDRNDNFSFEL